MALAASDSLSTFDQTNKQLDLEPVLATVLLADTALLGLVGMGTPALGIKHEFNEDVLNSYYITETTNALDATDVTITASAADVARIRAGTILKDAVAAQSELVQVTAIASTTTLTITRSYGSTTAVAHGATAKWLIVGEPVQHGDETITDISKVRSTAYNYCQEFKQTVKISDQLMAEAANGLHPGVPDELKYQILHRTLEIKREMNMSAIHMARGSAASDTVYSTMGGLRWFLTQTGAQHSTDLGSLTEKAVNKMYRNTFDQGGDPGDMVGGPDQITQFATFNAGKVRVAPSDRVAGVFIEKYLTELGKEISLTVDRWMPTDEVALIDKTRVYVSPFKGRALLAEPLARIGNAQRWQITGSCTFVVKNALLAHAYASALTVPA